MLVLIWPPLVHLLRGPAQAWQTLLAQTARRAAVGRCLQAFRCSCPRYDAGCCNEALAAGSYQTAEVQGY
jgi:hypothetical protein